MFGLGGILGGGGGGGLSASSSASTGDQTGGQSSFGDIGGFGSFAVGSGAKAEGGATSGGGGVNNMILYIAGGIAGLAVLLLGFSLLRK